MPRRIAITYVVIVLGLTLLPTPGAIPNDPITVHTMPFETIGRAIREGLMSGTFVLVMGNILMFIPLGVLVPLYGERLVVWPVLAAAFLLSAGIEATQLWISLAVGYEYRTADVDDVILNVAGALLGYAALRQWTSGGSDMA